MDKSVNLCFKHCLIKIIFMKTVFLLLAIGLFSIHGFGQNKPNIVWINVEDMSPRLGCYGDFTVPTPNIDRLAREGVRYTNVFTTAGVCAPSRNAIATGRIQTSNGGHNMRTLINTYPEKTGLPKQYSVVMPVGVKHFAEYLRAEGYYCTNNSKTDYQFEETPTVWDENGPKAHYKNRAKDQPFFAMIHSNTTHESQVWARAKNKLRVSPDQVKLPPFYPDTDSVRLDVARFYSNISEMDDWVGEKIKELESLGLLENTIVMFWSDHGDGLPYIKREVYDRGLRVPFIVRFGSSIANKTPKTDCKGCANNQLVSAIDWAPTVLSLAGIKPPKEMQGKALMGQFATQKPHQYVFAARDRLDSEYDRVRSVSDGEFQYVYNFRPEIARYMDIEYRKQQPSMREILRLRDAGKLNAIQMQWFNPTKPQEEFYDIKKDPHQINNLALDARYAKKIAQFRKVFQQWQKDVVDFGAISEKELVKQMWNGSNEPPQTADPVFEHNQNEIKISCKTEGASIGYKIIGADGVEPKRWEVYSHPLTIAPNSKIKSVAQRTGYKVSRQVVR
jgi:N-sulfoglucosamine sulfohydrolase